MLAQTMNAQSHGRSDDGPSGFRSLKPKKDFTKVTAESAKKLMNEIYQLEVDFGELGIFPQSESGFRQLKAQCDGKAREIVDLALVEMPLVHIKENLENLRRHNAPVPHRDQLGGRLYDGLIAKLEDCVRLTPEKRQEIAMATDAEAKMHDDTPGEAEAFLQRWRVSKYMLIKEGLVPVDPQTMIRQMQAAQPPGAPLSAEVLEIARKYCEVGYTLSLIHI